MPDASVAADAARLARVALMRAAESGDPVMGRLVEICGPVEALARIRSGDLPRRLLDDGPDGLGAPSTHTASPSGSRSRSRMAAPVHDHADNSVTRDSASIPANGLNHGNAIIPGTTRVQTRDDAPTRGSDTGHHVAKTLTGPGARADVETHADGTGAGAGGPEGGAGGTGVNAYDGGDLATPMPTWRRGHLHRRLEGWRARLLAADPACDLATGLAHGARLVVPGDVEWPTQLDDLGPARPLGLWLHGAADLRFSCLRSIALVGARAATAYGAYVATTFGADLSQAGWTIVSGGAYGVDGAAHRGALTGESPTVVVLACGVDFCYPKGHHDLFAAVRDQGVLVSECPPGVHPTRSRFLVRNRIIAALSRGTVVIEAALRSGALNTANHALTLRRHLGAVPGPITSESSHGCHRLLRQGKAICVTSGDEAIDLVGAIGEDLAPERRGPVLPRDTLSATTRSVLDAVPARGGAETATIAVAAGVDITTTLSCLGTLAAAGYIRRSPRGWRTLPHP